MVKKKKFTTNKMKIMFRCKGVQEEWKELRGFVVPPVVFIPNRDFLRDFVKMNNIKTTRVSKALGKSQNWLTQMMNDKRRDMTDATLKSIMKQLHIDWASTEFLHVRSEVPYRTRPANYKTTQHKERLQRDFWNGLVTK